MALKLKEYRSGFDRGPALADFLPYDSHDDGLFILKDGSLGMMWSLATITEEGLSEEERNRVRIAIEGVVMRIPTELACQIILVSSSRIEPVLQSFLSIGNLADSMTKLFLDSRLEIIRDASKNGFPGKRRRVPAENPLDLFHDSLLSRLAEAGTVRFSIVGTRPAGSFEEFLRDFLQAGKRKIRPAGTLRRRDTWQGPASVRNRSRRRS